MRRTRWGGRTSPRRSCASASLTASTRRFNEVLVPRQAGLRAPALHDARARDRADRRGRRDPRARAPGTAQRPKPHRRTRRHGLRGLEVFYPLHDADDTREFRETAKRYGLGHDRRAWISTTSATTPRASAWRSILPTSRLSSIWSKSSRDRRDGGRWPWRSTRRPNAAPQELDRRGRGLRSRRASRSLRAQRRRADGGRFDDQAVDRRNEPRAARAATSVGRRRSTAPDRSTRAACCTATSCWSRAAIRISRSESSPTARSRSKTRTTPTTDRRRRRPFRATRSPCCAISPRKWRRRASRASTAPSRRRVALSGSGPRGWNGRDRSHRLSSTTISST